MNKELFVTDLDGTLLNSDILISDSTCEILNQLIRQHVNITFATSRSYYTAKKLLENIEFHLPCITYNGVYVVDANTGDTIKSNLLHEKTLKEIFLLSQKMNMRPFIFCKDDNLNEKLIYNEPTNKAQKQFINERLNRSDKRLYKCDSYPNNIRELITISFLYSQQEVSRLEKEIRDKYEEKLSIKVIQDIYNDGYYSLEIANPNADKGKMLKYISEILSVNLNEVIVFGDQLNDLDMFKVAGKRIAVQNANSILKNHADLIIESNNDDAVAKYIKFAVNS